MYIGATFLCCLLFLNILSWYLYFLFGTSFPLCQVFIVIAKFYVFVWFK